MYNRDKIEIPALAKKNNKKNSRNFAGVLS